jgi:predicted phage terminase large subunit-like protein
VKGPRQLQGVAARVDVDPGLLAELHTLEAAYGGQSILDYMPRVSPIMPGGVPGVSPRHLLPIAEQIALAEYQPIRVCVSVPPRHGKTELILHAIAWWLQRHPEHTIAYCSYSGDIANGKSVRARDLALASGVPVRSDQARAGEWRTISGGGLLATGVGGPLTSHGANLVIVDDPVKNREEAESPTQRQKVWDWFTSTAMTRLTPLGSCIVVHTRWHGDDLIGRLKKQGGWTIINLPAYDETHDRWLWPEGGWDAKSLLPRRKDIGEYDWWALFQGEPRPKGGRMFAEPTFYERPVLLGGAKIMIACDPAATAKTHADYSVIIVGSIYTGPDKMPWLDILDVHRVQVEIPRLVQTLMYYQQRYRAPIGIEAVGGFKGVPQTLRQSLRGVKILEIKPTADKFTRALPTAAAWNAGRIRLPGVLTAAGTLEPDPTKPWVSTFLDELFEFTGIADDHDDQVDALAHLHYLASTTGQRRIHTAGEIARYLPFG